MTTAAWNPDRSWQPLGGHRAVIAARTPEAARNVRIPLPAGTAHADMTRWANALNRMLADMGSYLGVEARHVAVAFRDGHIDMARLAQSYNKAAD